MLRTVLQSTYIIIKEDNDIQVRNIVQAADKCIADAHIDKNQIDLIIDISIYRKENVIEPAMAHLIQKDIGINTIYKGGKQTFSFDLMNGANGFLSAVLMIDSFFKNNTIQKALIVSGDMHPSGKKTDDFPFAHVGAAALLENSGEKDKGFGRVMLYTSNKGHNGLKSYADLSNCSGKGRETITIEVDNDYHKKLEDFTVKSLESFYKDHIKPEKIDKQALKLIISQPAKDFANNIAGRIGLNEENVVNTFDKYGDTHTSALTAGYFEAINSGSIKEGDIVLFVGAGSGLTVSAALYRV